MARILKDDHTGLAWRAVMSHPASADLARPFDLSRVDREQLALMVEQMKEAERATRDFRRQLEAALAGVSLRSCPECDRAVTGRADAVYCGATCRQRARRAGRG